jgi:transcription termination factor NusB
LNLGLYEKYIVEPNSSSTKPRAYEKYIVEPKPTTAPTVYETDGSFRYVPLNEFEDYWKRMGKNPKERLKYLDKEEYVDRKTGLVGVKHVDHEPTWTERLIKEPLHGATIGLGTTADLASNYVAAPLLFLGSQIARGAEHLPFTPHAKQLTKKAADDLQSLSDKYWNQNVADEARNDPWLRTKNRDTTAAMLRGGGEFIPDIIPANALGTVVKRAAGPVKFAVKKTAPVAKGFVDKVKSKTIQLWNAPKATKVANILETPLTGKNVAGFAGAGAGHAYINTDNWGDEDQKPWWMELPFMMGGAGLASGIYGAAKRLGKSTLNLVKSSDKTPRYYKSLAKKINNGNNELDENFIKAVENTDVDLNPFNIYKNNDVPFKISKNNPRPEFLEFLPNMKKSIHDETEKVLDKSLVKYDKDDPLSDIAYASDLIRNVLKKSDTNSREITRAKYENVENDILDKFKLPAVTLLQKAKDIVKITSGVSSGKTGGNNIVNKVADDLIKALKKKKPISKPFKIGFEIGEKPKKVKKANDK